MRSAQSVAVLRSWQHLAHRIEPRFPLVLVLIGLGGWLIALSHNELSWSDDRVHHFLGDAGDLTLAYGGAILAPNGKTVDVMIREHPGGALCPIWSHAEVMNPLVWGGPPGETGLAAWILVLDARHQAVRSRVCRDRGRRRVALSGHRMAFLRHCITLSRA